MFEPIEKLIDELVLNFDSIAHERKLILQKLSSYIQQKINNKEAISLIYICTHNSRRSHFGQISAALAAKYFAIYNVKTFSGGTEETAFNKNAIEALQSLGFKISATSTEPNPIYKVNFSDEDFVYCFSKLFDHHINPSSNFAAVMTCSDAEQKCPFITGAQIRISTTYNDPKVFDGTTEQNIKYIERYIQIATETLYVFSLIKH
jgi:arsenate reductase